MISKMNYENFRSSLRSYVRDYFKLEEDEIYYDTDEDTEMLVVVCHDTELNAACCRIHMRSLFEQYEEHGDLEDLLNAVSQKIMMLRRADFSEVMENMLDYEKIKTHLFVVTKNATLHKKSVEKGISKCVGDVAQLISVDLGNFEDNIFSFQLPHNYLQVWDVNKQTLFDTALLNTYYLSPPRLYLIEKFLLYPGYEGEDFMSPGAEASVFRDAYGLCLSTRKRTNGAAAIFIPGVAQRIHDLLGQDYYIVFTSIHESMIHGINDTDPLGLMEVLKDTIKEATPLEDFLTFSIYRYINETGEILCAASYEVSEEDICTSV